MASKTALYDVFAVADGRNDHYRRGGHTFHVSQPVRLTEKQLTEEIRDDPWLRIVALDGSEVPVSEADAAVVAELEAERKSHAETRTALERAQVQIAELEQNGQRYAALQDAHGKTLSDLETARAERQAALDRVAELETALAQAQAAAPVQTDPATGGGEAPAAEGTSSP